MDPDEKKEEGRVQDWGVPVLYMRTQNGINFPWQRGDFEVERKTKGTRICHWNRKTSDTSEQQMNSQTRLNRTSEEDDAKAQPVA